MKVKVEGTRYMTYEGHANAALVNSEGQVVALFWYFIDAELVRDWFRGNGVELKVEAIRWMQFQGPVLKEDE